MIIPFICTAPHGHTPWNKAQGVRGTVSVMLLEFLMISVKLKIETKMKMQYLEIIAIRKVICLFQFEIREPHSGKLKTPETPLYSLP